MSYINSKRIHVKREEKMYKVENKLRKLIFKNANVIIIDRLLRIKQQSTIKITRMRGKKAQPDRPPGPVFHRL